jgi:hypothetical protein
MKMWGKIATTIAIAIAAEVMKEVAKNKYGEAWSCFLTMDEH